MAMLDQDKKALSVRPAIPRAKLRITVDPAMNLYTDTLGEPKTTKEESTDPIAFRF